METVDKYLAITSNIQELLQQLFTTACSVFSCVCMLLLTVQIFMH